MTELVTHGREDNLRYSNTDDSPKEYVFFDIIATLAADTSGGSRTPPRRAWEDEGDCSSEMGPPLGLDNLCQHNFENNRYLKA